MEPFGVLPRWLVVLRLIDVTIAILSINYWGLIKDGVTVFNMTGISYLMCGIAPLRFLSRGFKVDQKELLTKICGLCTIASMVILSFLVQRVIQESSKYQSFPSKDHGCEGCYSVMQACFGVMLLLNVLRSSLLTTVFYYLQAFHSFRITFQPPFCQPLVTVDKCELRQCHTAW